MLRILPALLIAVASPALADEKTACWDFGASPGVFGWEATPSTMCRDGKALPDSPTTSQGDNIASNTSVSTSNGPTELTLTFSGEAYVGLVVVKR